MGTLKMGDQAEASPEKKEGDESVEKTEGTEEKDAAEDGAPQEEEVEEEPLIDLTNYFVKPDQFDGIHILDAKFEKIDGAPNFRQLPGFPIFGTGQPTEAGMVEILKRAKGEKETAKVIWFTVRQEPVVYVNGAPYAPRAPDAPHAQMETKLDKAELDSVCVHLANVLKKQLKNSEEGTIKIHRDKNYAENPLERVDLEETLKIESIKDLESVYKESAEQSGVNLVVVNVPVAEDQASKVGATFDNIVNNLKDEPASTACVFSCQMGRGRTTLGMVVACLTKEIQLTGELRKMNELNLISSETLKDLLFEKFERIMYEPIEDEDPLCKGEFEVIKQLVETLPGGAEAKRKLDIILDKCGSPPKGAGVQNLRECIIETKWKYDVASEDKQMAYKTMIINFIERYFYLICFAKYSLEFAPSGYEKSFESWVKDSPDLVTMATEGKDKLEWSRTVDASKLEQLREIMADPNYKDNLSSLIRTIYDFAYLTYADLPRGQIKNNSMKKLAATTLMDILPQELSEKITKKIDEDPNCSHDFLTIVGMVSYF